MDLRINFASGVPIYVQLMEQIKHAVETGAIRKGEQLPTIRRIAEDLAMNPNTVARAYRELETEGIIEVRHGSGAYVAVLPGSAAKSAVMRRAADVLRPAIEKALAAGVSEPELRRIFESELARVNDGKPATRGRT
jgi:GntR family transcriptional regulator